MRSGLRSTAKKQSQAPVELVNKAWVRERSVDIQRAIYEGNTAQNNENKGLLSIRISGELSSDKSIASEDD